MESRLVWFEERDTPEDELRQKVAFHTNLDGTLTLSVASFSQLMNQLGYDRIEVA